MVVLNDATQHTTAVADVCNFGPAEALPLKRR